MEVTTLFLYSGSSHSSPNLPLPSPSCLLARGDHKPKPPTLASVRQRRGDTVAVPVCPYVAILLYKLKTNELALLEVSFLVFDSLNQLLLFNTFYI